MKLSKPKAIELIIAELQKGTATLDILGVIRSKWEFADSTFYRWLDIAKEQHKSTQQPIKEAVVAQTIDAEIEAKKTALEQRKKRLEILNKKFDELAEMQPKTLKYKDPKTGDNVEVKITKGDYLKGIEVLARLDDRISKAEGTDAPSKQEQTILDKRQGVVDYEIE